jgi:hypothetical protein
VPVLRRVVTIAATVTATAVISAAPAMAASASDLSATPADVSVQSVVYISGQDVVRGSCKAWMNRRTSDNYVQGLVQSWGDDCGMWLERKRIGSYDWTPVSNFYEVDDGVLDATAGTGFHWNGTDAGSRVCLFDYSRDTEAVCSPGYW